MESVIGGGLFLLLLGWLLVHIYKGGRSKIVWTAKDNRTRIIESPDDECTFIVQHLDSTSAIDDFWNETEKITGPNKQEARRKIEAWIKEFELLSDAYT